ncbi:MAG: hypothetical protein QM640_01040 [Niabella sp.]
MPATTEKNFYVDWFGTDGKLLAHQAYPVVNGTAAGQWIVPIYYEGSSIKVMAYTQGLLQTDSSRVFHRDIALLGIEAPPPFLLSLYPEGGSLTAGVSNRVGYHLTGMPAVEMQLISSTGDTLATIATKGQAYGSFRFIPEKGKAYSIQVPVSGMDNIPLPPVQEQGVALEVTPYTTFINVMLRKSPGMPATGWQLSGIMHGEVAYQSVFSLKSLDSGYVNIPVENLPEGELLLVLNDSRHQVLASRSVYIPGDRLPDGSLFQVTDKSGGGQAAKEWQLMYTDSVPALLSVAVSDALLPGQGASLRGWLLLGREVPDSLFEKRDITTQRAIDDILRCSARGKAGREKIPGIYHQDTSYFCLSGRVRGKKLPAAVNLIVRSNNRYAPVQLALDGQGRFRDSSFVLFDSCYVALATGQEQLSLEMDSLPPAAFKRYPFMGKEAVKSMTKGKNKRGEKQEKENPVTMNLPPQLAAYVDTTGQYRALPTVTVAPVKKWRTKADSVRSIYMSEQMQTSYPNGYDVNLDGDPSVYMGGATLWDILKGRIPAYKNMEQVKEVYWDDVQMNRDGVKELQLPNIAFVRYISHRSSSMTSKFGEDILLIYSKKYTDPTLKERLARNWGKSVIGYTSYIPFGQSFSPKDKKVPDRRKTLYWQPGIILSKDNPTIDIQFDNNDIAKKLLVVVEGVKADGTPVHYEKVIDK